MIERGRALGSALMAAMTIGALGCRSEATADRAPDATNPAPEVTTSDDECTPPEWLRTEPTPEIQGDEEPPAKDVSDAVDVILNDTTQAPLGNMGAGDGDAAPSVMRVRDDANDSPDSMLSRYPFFPIRVHGLPAVSANGKTVALVTVKDGTIAQGAEFDLDLYDVEQNRRRARVVLWSYAEEDAREDLNDSLGTAQASAKRMDDRMSRANALLRATSSSWERLEKMPPKADPNDDTNDVPKEVYIGIGFMVTVAHGRAHIDDLRNFPALRRP